MVNLIPLPIRKVLGNWWHAKQERKRHTSLLRELSGTGVVCNVCNWEGRAFTDDTWHPGTICPVCRSQVRHRMLSAIFDGLSDPPGLDEASLLEGRDILHFAPERQLRERVAKAASRYTTADYDRGDCDLKLDMSDMPQVPANSLDVVIACDVLEHVPCDFSAIKELHRILRSKGIAILTVPQKDSPSSTDEDSTVTDPIERERRFGQKDHVRMYGDDLRERLERGGFEIRMISEKSFINEVVKKYILSPMTANSNPLATNKRRIYFARKV